MFLGDTDCWKSGLDDAALECWRIVYQTLPSKQSTLLAVQNLFKYFNFDIKNAQNILKVLSDVGAKVPEEFQDRVIALSEKGWRIKAVIGSNHISTILSIIVRLTKPSSNPFSHIGSRL